MLVEHSLVERDVLLRKRNNDLMKSKTFNDILDISLKTLEGVYPLISCAGNTFITDRNCDLESLTKEGSNKLNKDGEIIYKINENGLFTLDSQSGKIDQNIKQRSYLTGIISYQNASIIHKKIHMEYEDIISAFVKNDNTQNPNIWGVPVTYNKKDNILNPYTHIHFDHEYNFENLLNKNLRETIKKDYVTIHFIDTKFGRSANGKNGLFRRILKLLKEL